MFMMYVYKIVVFVVTAINDKYAVDIEIGVVISRSWHPRSPTV